MSYDYVLISLSEHVTHMRECQMRMVLPGPELSQYKSVLAKHFPCVTWHVEDDGSEWARRARAQMVVWNSCSRQMMARDLSKPLAAFARTSA
jgi:hypothetical protein